MTDHFLGRFREIEAAAPPEERAIASERQIHFGPVGGFFWDVRTDVVGIRVRYESFRYVETVNSTTLEMKYQALLGTEVMLWL